MPRAEKYQIAGQGKKGFENLYYLDNQAALTFINYFKFTSGLNLGETRRPQMGSMEFLTKSNEKIYFRISTIGDFNNRESLVLRIIYPVISKLNLFRPQDLINLEQFTKRRGLMLFSGPTGSGKTTLIYYLARKLALKSMVMSIEDPVEVYEPLFLQTQVNLSANMSYSEIIKASLRHRPDVLIIGEIRDEKSAHAAITASLSGHLVFSTVHARSIYGVLERLTDLGISSSTIKNCLNSICYQRIIPDTNQNLQTMTQIFDGFKSDYHFTEKQVLKSWQNQLITSLKLGQISKETFERYFYG
ncbi:competence protein [Xylocopilactobacillus apis]|uniref:Competence protein n=1 Tax=Xylocopilactobacillus apis TaxID=2932183 RepID=A0AAU9D4P4_9LACO|nr:competence protein [Xylocopilactobacillus apis]